jgi:cell division septal protein FtsQ
MSRHFKTNYLKKQKQRYFKRIVVFLLFFVLISAIVYFIIFSNFFHISHVQILGLKRVPKEVVKKEIDNILNEKKLIPLNDNLLFIKSKDIKSIFLADISNIYVTKNFFTKTLNVHIVEKKPIAKIVLEYKNDSAFTDSADGNMYLDDSGNIFKSALLSDEKIITIRIKNQNDNLPKNLLDQEKINNFINFVKYLNQNPNYINKFDFEYSLNTPSAVMLYIQNQYNVYLTLNNEIINAFNTAESFYQKEKKGLISHYIDMRYYPEKLYYK